MLEISVLERYETKRGGNWSKGLENRKIGFKSWFFPGGENGFTLTDNKISLFNCAYCLITARLQSGNDLLEMLSAVNAVKTYTNNRCPIKLRIPYWPAARQDRISNPGEALTTKIYADIINTLECDEVEIVDPHSDVTPALINNISIINIVNTIAITVEDCKPDYIIVPDAGAAKRIEKLLTQYDCDIPTIQCLKKRDTKTGKLSGFQVICERKQLDNKKCLIIDDICDGGGTFLGLADELKNLPDNLVGDLYLYVTHGIFSQGVANLLEKFKKIYTTNTFKSGFLITTNPNVVVHEVV